MREEAAQIVRNTFRSRPWDVLQMTVDTVGSPFRDAPDFVEVGEAGIAVDDVMRRQRRVQLVG